ncbi:unnamed protein product, partial [marine sediment metagenome]
ISNLKLGYCVIEKILDIWHWDFEIHPRPLQMSGIHLSFII